MALTAVFAGVASTGVEAVNLSQDLIGDTLIYPYYTVRKDTDNRSWFTDFNVTNTSDSTVAAKVRFHEGRNSREVLDFIVVLSPQDMFSAYAVEGATGPELVIPSTEKSCVVAGPDLQTRANGDRALAFKNLHYSYPLYWDGFVQDVPANGTDIQKRNDIDRAREGYFTVIEMGAAPPGWENDSTKVVPYNALHQAGVPRDCAKVDDAFKVPAIYKTYTEFERNLNNLKGNFLVTNIARGTQGGGNAVTLANFGTVASDLYPTETSFGYWQNAVNQANSAATTALAAITNPQTGLQLKLEQAVSNCGGGAAAFVTTGNGTYNAGQTPGSVALFDNDTVQDDKTIALFAPSGATPGCPAVGSPGFVAVANAANAYNAKVDEFYNAAAVLANAIAQQLLPPWNLIHAQDVGPDVFGNTVEFYRYPDLNTGDKTAYMLIDGLYDQATADGFLRFLAGLPPEAATGATGWPALYGGQYFRGVDAVTALLMKSSAINEWADNGGTGAQTDLVYTAPTKSYYSDWKYVYAQQHVLQVISPILTDIIANNPAGWPPFSEQFSKNQGGSACDAVRIGIWNNDERHVAGEFGTSPWVPDAFCWEVNLRYTGDESLLASKLGELVDLSSLPGGPTEKYNGWLEVDMTYEPSAYHPAIPISLGIPPGVPFPSQTTFFALQGNSLVTIPYRLIPQDPLATVAVPPGVDLPNPTPIIPVLPGYAWAQRGLPYIGFAYKERNWQGAGGIGPKKYGTILDHSYQRDFEARNYLGGQL